MHPLGFRSVASLNNLTQPWRTLCPIWQFAAYAAFCFLQMARPHTNVLKFCKPKYAKNRRCYRYTQCYRYKIMATIYRRCRRCFLFRFTPFYAFFPFLLREQLFQFFNNCSLYFVLSNLAVMFVTEFSTSNYSLHACWLTPFHAACTTVVHKLTLHSFWITLLFVDSATIVYPICWFSCCVCCGGALQVNWCGYGCLLMCSFAVLLVAVICGWYIHRYRVICCVCDTCGVELFWCVYDVCGGDVCVVYR